jgi:hypothetical protein
MGRTSLWTAFIVAAQVAVVLIALAAAYHGVG